MATNHSTVVRIKQGEVGTEEGLVHSKCSSSFLGKARIPSGAHLAQEQLLAGLNLAGVSRICAAPSPPHPSLRLTADSPGILGFLAGFLPAACTDILVPSGDKIHPWPLQPILRAHRSKQMLSLLPSSGHVSKVATSPFCRTDAPAG